MAENNSAIEYRSHWDQKAVEKCLYLYEQSLKTKHQFYYSCINNNNKAKQNARRFNMCVSICLHNLHLYILIKKSFLYVEAFKTQYMLAYMQINRA